VFVFWQHLEPSRHQQMPQQEDLTHQLLQGLITLP
jgi:hypothetical protein